MPPGPYPRAGLALLAIGALLVLGRLYARAEHGDVSLAVSAALVAGGAIGNLLDRLSSTRGVVDFIDVGVGDRRFWIFNVADVGVTIGALALAVLISRRETQRVEG
jgi:signal peptidase II